MSQQQEKRKLLIWIILLYFLTIHQILLLSINPNDLNVLQKLRHQVLRSHINSSKQITLDNFVITLITLYICKYTDSKFFIPILINKLILISLYKFFIIYRYSDIPMIFSKNSCIGI